MKNVVVVGSQWGDEGKGKIVDWLSSEADVVVRFQGGDNAGHTLVIDKKVFKLRLLPSGIVRKGKISILGNGVVIDPWALLSEIEEINKQGIEVTSENFMISETASLILPFHQEMDEILSLALRVNDFMSGIFYGVGIRLVDFKIEIGRIFESDFQRLVIADEISPDSCRLWDINSGEKLDKDVFRRDLGNLTDAYSEVAIRLGVIQPANSKAAAPRLVK